jgi:hypothetical protein
MRSLVVFSSLLISALALVAQPIHRSTNQQVKAEYVQLPLAFEVNRGQVDPKVNFVAHGAGYTLFLTSRESILSLNKSAGPRTVANGANNPEAPAAAVLRIAMPHANLTHSAAVDLLPGKSNYFLGKQPAQWHTDVPTYARVRYHEVYPGVDLLYYGNQRRLEYDFVIAPGADYKSIGLAISGVRNIRVDDDGSLVLQTANGEVRQQRPEAYQQIAGVRKSVASRYLLRRDNQVSFELGNYDREQPVIIDPVIDYSTYLGGSGTDFVSGIALDGQRNIYVAGGTSSPDFPVANAEQSTSAGGTDAFVAKLSADGSTLLYSTYIGGNSSDSANAIAVDSAGEAFVAGQTSSGNFPTATDLQSTPGGGDDGFVLKLNAAGSAFLYSTYLGGSNSDSIRGLAIDSAGNAYVAGSTASTNFPTASAFQPAKAGGLFDAFVAKLNPKGSALLFSTYLGGSGSDSAFGIAVDNGGQVYVTGSTASADFPTANALQAKNQGGPSGSDAFVTKFAPSGTSLVYSTYLGGSNDEQANGIAVDGPGNAYVTGFTLSHDFPTVRPFQSANAGGFDVFLSKIDASGSALTYSTYFGGSDDDEGFAITVDRDGNASLTGDTFSTDLPLKNAVQANPGGSEDAFVARFNPPGKLVFSTYLGGSSFDRGIAIAIDALGKMYVGGFTSSIDFPTRNAFQPSNRGDLDGFVTVINPEGDPAQTGTAIDEPPQP